VPWVREDVARVAMPALMVPEPMAVPLLRKETVPVGVPDFAVTVAVKVVESPAVMVAGEAVSAVEVLTAVGAAALTVSVTAVEVEVLKLVVPVYLAVMVYVPWVREDVAKVAMPLLMVPEPMAVPLLRKETVPVGVPDFAVTVAVKVVESPAVMVVGDAVSDVVVLTAVGAAAVTVSVTAVEVEVLKLELPVNLAVMV